MGTKIGRAVIFGSAPCTDWSFLRGRVGDGDLVICADGGIQRARAAGLTPDAAVGDWDSGGTPQPGLACISLPPEKDMTDLQAAVDLAVERGCGQLLLCGCTGGPRLDHTASNLALLEYIADRGADGILLDPDNEVRLLGPGTLVLEGARAYHYFSLIPLDRQVTGVTLRGVKYPLNHATLTRGSTFSVSNEPLVRTVAITLESGRALLVRSQRTGE